LNGQSTHTDNVSNDVLVTTRITKSRTMSNTDISFEIVFSETETIGLHDIPLPDATTGRNVGSTNSESNEETQELLALCNIKSKADILLREARKLKRADDNENNAIWQRTNNDNTQTIHREELSRLKRINSILDKQFCRSGYHF
jgi:hypothetical protein